MTRRTRRAWTPTITWSRVSRLRPTHVSTGARGSKTAASIGRLSISSRRARPISTRPIEKERSQRRVDAFVQIVRDPRLQRYPDDIAIKRFTGTSTQEAITDHRLNNASSCMGCHIDGMNRSNNDLDMGLTKAAAACRKASTVWMGGSMTPPLFRMFASSVHRPQSCAASRKTIAACF